VAGTDPAWRIGAGTSNIVWRVVSALVLAPLAIGAAYVGGLPFAAFWGAAAAGVLWEWCHLVAPNDRHIIFAIGAASLLLALALAEFNELTSAMLILGMGMLGVAALASSGRRAWVAGGIVYSAAICFLPILLRDDPAHGFTVMVLLFAVVWTTDIAAYVVGRALGGPKLWPRVSPNKTWSGAIAGIVAAVAAAVVVAMAAGLAGTGYIAGVALMLSVASQVGDLFESIVKRRFGAKDAGRIIPGHGGLMDRLDGFVAAALAAVAIGFARGAFDAPARGLTMW
jgi:phosphatidate cytidylyltransferase